MRRTCVLIFSLLLGSVLLSGGNNTRSANVLPAVMIERFQAIPDCIFPDPHRGILSYRISGGVTRITLSALDHDGRVRPFLSYRLPTTSLIERTNIADPGATSDVEGYRLVARGADGSTATRDLAFRYRVARFQPIPPARHLRDTTGGDFFTRYESNARLERVDSLTCSFRFDAPIAGESGRAGAATFTGSGSSAVVFCEIRWRSLRKAQAGGTVEWVARVTDQSTQGRIVRTARINPIP